MISHVRSTNFSLSRGTSFSKRWNFHVSLFESIFKIHRLSTWIYIIHYLHRLARIDFVFEERSFFSFSCPLHYYYFFFNLVTILRYFKVLFNLKSSSKISFKSSFVITILFKNYGENFKNVEVKFLFTIKRKNNETINSLWSVSLSTYYLFIYFFFWIIIFQIYLHKTSLLLSATSKGRRDENKKGDISPGCTKESKFAGRILA